MPGVIWQSALWSLLWMVSVALLVFKYTWLIEHDYPEDIRNTMKPVTPTEAQKKQGNVVMAVGWLIVCTIRPKIIVPPGTEHCAGWRDYGFHFKGFLHGCVYMSLFALVFAGIDYAILHFLVW